MVNVCMLPSQITAATGAVTSGGRIDVSTRLAKTTAMSALATTVSPRDLLGIPIFIVAMVVVVTVVEAMQVAVMVRGCLPLHII